MCGACPSYLIKTKAIKSNVATNKKTETFKATGPAVRRLRKQLNMNKSEFAKLVGVSVPSITNWESKRGKLVLKEASLTGLIKTWKLNG